MTNWKNRSIIHQFYTDYDNVYNNTTSWISWLRLLDLIVNTELIVMQKIRRDCVISYESSASYELQLALQRNLRVQIRLISVLSKLTVILFCMKYLQIMRVCITDYYNMYYTRRNFFLLISFRESEKWIFKASILFSSEMKQKLIIKIF